MNRPKVGVGVAVLRDNQVLLGKRIGSHGEGEWAFPGGHLEFGETVEACARRELLKETGIRALALETGGWSSDVMTEDKHYITLFAIVRSFEGEPQLLEPDKCAGWQWFPLNALPEPLFAPIHTFLKLKAPHEKILASLLALYEARDWDQFHSPKNLVMDLGSEVGELLDLFRWMTEEESRQPQPEVLQDARDEVADVFKAVLYLAHKLKIDPIEAARQKIEKIGQKYPVEKSRGKALKYTAYGSK